MKVVLIILEVLLLFNLLIAVHEWGHFLAARWRGLKVEAFAIWFGRAIWKKKINGVEYRLGWIPAGGYVALPQMAPMDMLEGTAREEAAKLPTISALDKIIVAFAGPLFSFLLAVAFAAVVWVVGRPVPDHERTTTIGWVERDGPAGRAGLRPGDRILAVDGFPVTKFLSATPDSVTWRVISSEGSNIVVTVQRGDEKLDIAVKPIIRAHRWYERKNHREIQIAPVEPAILAEVVTNSPAAAGGLMRGDQVISVDGAPVLNPRTVFELRDRFSNQAPVAVKFGVRRGSNEFTVAMTAERPVKPTNVPPAFGFNGWLGNTNVVMAYPTPFDQVRSSVETIFSTLGTLFSRKSDVSVQQLGGAVMIIRVYKNLFEDENGWRLVLWFSVVMNVNLALLNLLPFPVLDGGHITLALWEIIRRRPASGRVLGYLQNACAISLIGFMLYIAFFDTGDWVRSSRRDRQGPGPIEFAPKP